MSGISHHPDRSLPTRQVKDAQPPETGGAAPGALTSTPTRAGGDWIPGYFNDAELSMSLRPFILAFVQKKQM